MIAADLLSHYRRTGGLPLPTRGELLGLAIGGGVLGLYLVFASRWVPVYFPTMPPIYHGLAWGVTFLCALLIGGVDALVLWKIHRDRRRPEPAQAYEHFGPYLLFVGLVILQLGHLAEHLIQNAQLMVTHGDISRSHGLIGQLDLELVHFVWDEAIWVLTGLLLIYYWRSSVWLWVSWIVASVHGLEHCYMFFWKIFDASVYYAGGIDGILSQGGLIGSALARPYAHLTYNVIVIGTGYMAYWAVSRRLNVSSQKAA